MERLERLEAIEAIRALKARYFRLIDTRQWDELRGVFCPDLKIVTPDGKVWLFHTSQPGGRQDECEVHYRRSRDGGETFGETRRLGDFRGVFVRQPPCLGPKGEWLLPGFRCVTPPQGRWSRGWSAGRRACSACRRGTAW